MDRNTSALPDVWLFFSEEPKPDITAEFLVQWMVAEGIGNRRLLYFNQQCDFCEELIIKRGRFAGSVPLRLSTGGAISRVEDALTQIGLDLEDQVRKRKRAYRPL